MSSGNILNGRNQSYAKKVKMEDGVATVNIIQQFLLDHLAILQCARNTFRHPRTG